MRIPFFLRWLASVKPGATDALVANIDSWASFAALTGQSLAPGDAPDCFNVLPALLGESKTGRSKFVEHSGILALRDGPQKYIEPARATGQKAQAGAGSGGVGQFYDLSADFAEPSNTAAQYADKVKAPSGEIQEIREKPASR